MDSSRAAVKMLMCKAGGEREEGREREKEREIILLKITYIAILFWMHSVQNCHLKNTKGPGEEGWMRAGDLTANECLRHYSVG